MIGAASFSAHSVLDGFAMANPDTAGRILTRYLAPVTTRFDRGHLQQILTNLLSNGCKYNRPGGQLRVSARAEGSTVWARTAVLPATNAAAAPAEASA